MKPPGPGAYFGSLLIIDLISLTNRTIQLLFLLVWVLVYCIFQRIGQFYLGFVGKDFFTEFLLFLSMSMGSVSDGLSYISDIGNFYVLFTWLAWLEVC